MEVQQAFSLTDKIAVVTGSCGLIGRHHCFALAEAGAKVVACDLDAGASEALAAELGPEHLGLSVDIADADSLGAARDRILGHYGQIDVLVNNAAINDMFENPALAAQQSMFEHYPVEMFKRSLEVNVTGVFLSSQILGTPMAERGQGSIINVASTYGMVGPDQKIYRDASGKQAFYKSPSYPTGKGAILNFTRFLAAYWGPKGIRVNSLSPGGVENGQDDWFIHNYSEKTLLGRMAGAHDYKGAVVFLASDASAYMTGANLVVDGGWTAI